MPPSPFVLTHIINSVDGTIKVCYTYDAWGNYTFTETVTGLAEINPFRYRGYYYDSFGSTGCKGLYYLQSRYYDPETGRFISQDNVSYLDPETINGLNLYAYCGNNPVMYTDPSGEILLTTLIITAFVLAGATVGGIMFYNGASAAGYTGWELAGLTALGALLGGCIGFGVGYLAAPAIAGFLTSSFSFSIPYFTMSGGSGAIAYATVTVTGANIVGASIAASILYATYNGGWPGDNPNTSPGEGFEWRGGDKGSWYNPETKEMLRPDLGHPNPIGPHWDFRDVFGKFWRIFRNGTMLPK